MRAIEGVRPAWLRRRLDLRRVMTHDFPLKAAAIVIAIVFWVANAQNAAPRLVTVAFDGRVPVERPDNVPSGYVLRGQLGDVGVTLRGIAGTADRVALSDLHATIDVKSLTLGRAEPQDARVIVTVAKDGVEVVDVLPATISVRVEKLTSRNIPVQPRFANSPPSGARAGDAAVNPTEVRVTGPESDISRIVAVLATVGFGDAQTDIETSTPAIAVDAAGAPIDGLQMEPGVVVVKVPVLPIATTRTVPVVFNLRGAVAAGYWVVGVAMDPFAVTVRGDEKVLATLDRIETLAIDVGGLSATKTQSVGLAIPEGVTLLKPTDVTVTMTVQPLTGTRLFTSVVVVTGLATNQVADVDPTSVTVLFAGPVPALTALTTDQASATVDASGRAPGTYTLDVIVRAPSGVTVQTLQPPRVAVTIRSR
ncbi:MAG TPA: CdaR family protein [Candidatus Limnocylindria bacterium]|nr:CdaR family protein [Candidatus Limnocylindria bacterium]